MPEFAPVPRAALPIVSGSRASENIVSQRVKIQMADRIVTYMPSAYPLSVLTRRLRDTFSVDNHKFEWLESDEFPRDLELTGNALVGDTTLDVTAGDEARVSASYILLNTRSREQVRVSSTGSGVVTVVRDIGGGGQKDMLAGDILVFTRPVAENGADIATALSTKDVAKYNFTEIVRTPLDFTRRGSKTALFGGKDPMTERKKMAIEQAKSIEQALFFGQRNSRTGSGGHLETYTGGLEYWVTDNVWDVSGTGSVTERAFDEFLEEGMRWGLGGNQKGQGLKYLLASSRWITEINWFAKGKLEYRSLDDTIGFGAFEYLSPHGRVRIMHAPVLDYQHQGYAYLIDPNHLSYVYFADDDTSLLKDRGGNGVDGFKEEFLTDCGLKVELSGAHSVFKGLS